MTYRQLLDALREAKERLSALEHHSGTYHNFDDPESADNWDAEYRHLNELLDEEIVFE